MGSSEDDSVRGLKGYRVAFQNNRDWGCIWLEGTELKMSRTKKGESMLTCGNWSALGWRTKGVENAGGKVEKVQAFLQILQAFLDYIYFSFVFFLLCYQLTYYISQVKFSLILKVRMYKTDATDYN